MRARGMSKWKGIKEEERGIQDTTWSNDVMSYNVKKRTLCEANQGRIENAKG